MAEYIKREYAIKTHCNICRETCVCDGNKACCYEVKAFKRIPAADVVEVVRCKDCLHSYDSVGGLCCSHGICVDCVVQEDFYCAFGAKMEADTPT